MRELALLTFITLDGVMQGPTSPDEDPSNGFTGGGWATPHWAEVMDQVREHAMAHPYDILFGRKTYDLFAGHFSSSGAGNDSSTESRRLSEATKYVVTSRSTGLNWPVSHAVTGNIAEQVRDLKHGDGPPLQVHGSWQLVQLLLENNLVDEFRLWTFPTVVGAGKRLFEGGAAPCDLQLRRSAKCPSGAMMSIYRRR